MGRGQVQFLRLLHRYPDSVAGLEMKDGGRTRGSGGLKSPAGYRGRATVGVWGLRPQKLTTYYENNYRK